jgi:hypothetical protein
MPRLNGIISVINSEISSALNIEKFQGGVLYNQIAELVPEIDRDSTRTTKPAIIDHYGEGTSVIIDDTLPFQIYHRLLSINNVSIPGDNFGDAGQTIEETANMVMIVISDRGKILMQGYDFLAGICVNMPQALSSAQNATLDLLSCIIEIEGTNTNIEEVYNQEYSVSNYGLKPNSIMYSVSYKIITTFSKECFPLCE